MYLVLNNIEALTMQANMPLALIDIFEILPFHLLSFFILTLLSIIFLYKWLKPKQMVLMPASPPKLPIIGHLHLLNKLPHHSLTSLAHKYGDIFMLYLGNRPTLVLSSATAAEEIFKTHDLIFANKAKQRFVHRIFYDGNDVGFGSYDEKWRRLKSICVLQLLSNKRVRSFQSIRDEEVGQVLKEIKSYNGSVINLSETFLMFMKSLICRIALGRNYNDNDKFSKGFYGLMKELVAVMVEVSLGDYVPYLSWVDKLTGLEGRVEKVRKQFDDFIEDVIREHEGRLNNNAKQVYNYEKDDDKGQRVKDFVDVLLEIQRDDSEQLSRVSIKGLILDMFIAGTETSSTTLDWVMTELLRHPKVMRKVQEEMRSIVKTKERVTEDDLTKLKYLKAVIKETLRVHPPGPLLVFRESSQKVKIDKYDISARTQVIINAWAIQRDPKYWRDPEAFRPERFLDDNAPPIDFIGQHHQYVPFGAGRRGCPGIAFAMVNVELILATLLYEFNWALPNGKGGETLDVEERVGTAVGRKNPLMVVATPAIPFLLQ